MQEGYGRGLAVGMLLGDSNTAALEGRLRGSRERSRSLEQALQDMGQELADEKGSKIYGWALAATLRDVLRQLVPGREAEIQAAIEQTFVTSYLKNVQAIAVKNGGDLSSEELTAATENARALKVDTFKRLRLP